MSPDFLTELARVVQFAFDNEALFIEAFFPDTPNCTLNCFYLTGHTCRFKIEDDESGLVTEDFNTCAIEEYLYWVETVQYLEAVKKG